MRTLLLTLAACSGGSTKSQTEAQVPGLELGPIQTCSAPRSSPSWQDASGAWDVPEPTQVDEAAGSASSLGVVDLDRDGLLDMVVAYGDDDLGLVILWQEENGWDWERVDGTVPGEALEGVGLGLADLDQDGLLDLTLAGEEPVLLENTGQGLSPHPVPVPLLGVVRELLPVDLDGDGVLDLVAGMSDPDPERSGDRILWGDGNLFDGGGLTAELLSGAGAAGENWDTIVWDSDDDGIPDIYTTNDKGHSRGPNALYQGPSYDDEAPSRGADLRVDGMGSSLGDVDGDGRADVYVAAVGRDAVLLGQEDGGFVDGASALGASPEGRTADQRLVGMPWGTALWDADNDGWTDILVAEGDFGSDDLARLGRQPVLQDLRLMHQEEPGAFEDLTGEWLASPEGHWRAVVAVDLNADGVQDVVATRQGKAPTVFLSEGCTASGWLAVDAPVGSVVTASVGDRTLRSWVTADPGFGAVLFPHAWLGLGSHTAVDDLEIALPSGQSISTGPLDARRWITVER